MAVVVRCPLLGCGNLTGWTYPDFEWARAHVRGLPPRCFLFDRDQLGRARDLCPDPLGHVNRFLADHGKPELTVEADVGSEPEEEESEDPELDPDEEPEPDDLGVAWVENRGFRFPQLG